jgi:ATP-dependent Clp protease ATP-binding subunit ClpA
MASIVNKELDIFRDQLREKNVTLEVTETCVNRLAEEGYSREFGARNVGRAVEEKIKSFFIDEVLFGRLSSGGAARADYIDGEYRIEILAEEELHV